MMLKNRFFLLFEENENYESFPFKKLTRDIKLKKYQNLTHL